jgi:hypothetical protein
LVFKANSFKEEMLNPGLKANTISAFGLLAFLIAVSSFSLPRIGYNKVAYYTFDATPVGQGTFSLTAFTDRANIVVIFEGTLWELADTVHYNTRWMRNAVYRSKKQVLDDIQALRKKGVLVLMNVDDAASWSTATPFTTWNGKACDYRQFAAFVDSCVTAAGLDGISLDVEHKAEDNTNYRNVIKEFGKYFGPLSSSPLTKMYIGAFYSGRDGAPGPVFREAELHRYLNFLMDMGYQRDNMTRFNYWADSLGNAKVMIGMSHQYNSLDSAVDWASWHPKPEKAGVMVYAANVNKAYTDSIFSALGDETVLSNQKIIAPIKTQLRIIKTCRSPVFHFSINAAALVSLTIVSVNGRTYRRLFKNRCKPGEYAVKWDPAGDRQGSSSAGIYYAVLAVNGTVVSAARIIFLSQRY